MNKSFSQIKKREIEKRTEIPVRFLLQSIQIVRYSPVSSISPFPELELVSAAAVPSFGWTSS